ncbi:MAG: hypothetical protein PHF37_07890 [Phycisphaerae bacterium]|nr:hypothetical protein [Phycisphaerae bacterium]
MRLFNWAQSFKETPTCDDILNKVQKTEIAYWIFLLISVGIAIWGLNVLIDAPDNNLKQHFMGLFLALTGIVNVAVIKIWAHVRLTMYFTIWDSQNRIENEIRKSEIQDL